MSGTQPAKRIAEIAILNSPRSNITGKFDGWPRARPLHAGTTMLRLGSRRRTVLVETLRELANLVAGALVLGRLVAGQPWSFRWMLAGIIAWATLLGFALLFAEERNNG